MLSLKRAESLVVEDPAEDLARISDAMRIQTAGFVAFALVDNEPARAAAMADLTLRLAGEVEIRPVELTPDEPYLYDKLTAPAGDDRVAYFAYGFEAISGAARGQAFGALQIQREGIGRLTTPVVLWLVERDLIDLARHAPDFFAWRGGLYDFRSPRPSAQRAPAAGHIV